MRYSLIRAGSLCVATILSFIVSGQVLAADVEAEFRKAMAAREAGELDDSIVIFQSILGQEPSLHRARLELAVAYYRATRFEEAEQQAKKVLDDPKTPATVRLSIVAFLAKIQAERKRFEKTGSTRNFLVAAGFLHDTNVNVGPGSDVINLGTATLRLAAGSTPQSDNAITLAGTFNYSYQTGKTVNAGGRTAAVLWQSQASVYTKQYQDLSEFNLDVVSLSTGLAFIAPKAWRANINLRLDNIELGSDRLAFYTSLLPSVTWQLGNSTELTLDAAIADRDYKQTTDEGRDNTYKSVGVSLGKLFMKGKVSLQGGVSFFDEEADDDRFSRDGTRFYIGANWKAWNNGSVYANFSQRDSKHDAPEALFNEKRDEREQIFSIGFVHRFANQYLNKWVLRGRYTNTDNDSNIDIFTYDREVTGVTFSRTF